MKKLIIDIVLLFVAVGFMALAFMLPWLIDEKEFMRGNHDSNDTRQVHRR